MCDSPKISHIWQNHISKYLISWGRKNE
jgi:hypothetical protein